jgi:hypothetical protein
MIGTIQFSSCTGALIEAPVDFYKTQMQIQLNKVREIPGYEWIWLFFERVLN